MSASYPQSPTGAVPAGWYPDVDQPGSERWWNGALWTEHRRPTLDPTLAGQPPTAFGLSSGASERPVSLDKTGVRPATQQFPALAVGSPAVPPGWYPDPSGGPHPRWWDGVTWAASTAPPAWPATAWPASTTVVNVGAPKSVGVAFLLTFLFGPFGMFYSTVAGALIMLGVGFVGGLVFGILTFGLIWFIWAPLIWVVSIVWGCVAVPTTTSTTVYHR